VVPDGDIHNDTTPCARGTRSFCVPTIEQRFRSSLTSFTITGHCGVRPLLQMLRWWRGVLSQTQRTVHGRQIGEREHRTRNLSTRHSHRPLLTTQFTTNFTRHSHRPILTTQFTTNFCKKLSSTVRYCISISFPKIISKYSC
jgi:hypothetical protein